MKPIISIELRLVSSSSKMTFMMSTVLLDTEKGACAVEEVGDGGIGKGASELLRLPLRLLSRDEGAYLAELGGSYDILVGKFVGFLGDDDES